MLKSEERLKCQLLEAITNSYLDTQDFNGMSLRSLEKNFGYGRDLLLKLITELIEEELLGVIDEDTDVNPHIIRMGFEPVDRQISKLGKPDFSHICIYPRPKHLKKVIDYDRYKEQPYKLCLALGEAQLAFRSFDLSVLEFYRNDPRYKYDNDDIQGNISYESDNLDTRDQILLESFGFSYDNNLNRAVAVFLRYLKDLTPEHQGIWKSKELEGDYQLHPAYYKNAVIGQWGDKAPICTALVNEIYLINKMAEVMYRPPLFIEDFGKYGQNKPKKFGFLIRPTLEEFNNFILLLDKMLSDNINKDFFLNEVPYEKEIERRDGKIQVIPKGTLQILDDWIRKSFRTDDWGPWEESITTLRKIRKLRQKPAHSINEDKFDQKYFKKQREIIIEAYKAVRTIRLMFTNFPGVKSYVEIPEYLYKGKIWRI